MVGTFLDIWGRFSVLLRHHHSAGQQDNRYLLCIGEKICDEAIRTQRTVPVCLEKNVPGQPKRTRDVFHLPIACQRRSFDAIGFYAVGDEVIFLDFAVCQHDGREDK